MVPARLRRFPRFSLAAWALSVPLLAQAYSRPMSDLLEQGPPPHAAGSLASRTFAPLWKRTTIQGGVIPVNHLLPTPEQPARFPVAAEVHLSLSTVLRLADDRNAQLAQLRARVDASVAADLVANHSCLPNTLRPESQRRTTADAKVWQVRAELARVRGDVLQEAGNAYVDWLTALRGEAVARELEKYERKLLPKAQTLARDEKGAAGLVESVQTSLGGRRQAIARLHQQAQAAAAKLAYLINQCGTVPLAAEILEAVELADTSVPGEVLVHQAQDNGPGVRELAGLESVIATALAEAHGLQRACKLTHCVALCARLQEAEARLREVHFAREDLAGKLEAGVREACSATVAGREQIAAGSEQIGHAAEGYRLGNARLDESITGQTVTEVFQSIRGLEAAHLGYVQAVSAYDKAQVRLCVLLGDSGAEHYPAP